MRTGMSRPDFFRLAAFFARCFGIRWNLSFGSRKNDTIGIRFSQSPSHFHHHENVCIRAERKDASGLFFGRFWDDLSQLIRILKSIRICGVHNTTTTKSGPLLKNNI